jgi:hypothetical protein
MPACLILKNGVIKAGKALVPHFVKTVFSIRRNILKIYLQNWFNYHKCISVQIKR